MSENPGAKKGFLDENGIGSYTAFVKSIILPTEEAEKLPAFALTPPTSYGQDDTVTSTNSFQIRIKDQLLATVNDIMPFSIETTKIAYNQQYFVERISGAALSISRPDEVFYSGGDNSMSYHSSKPMSYSNIQLRNIETESRLFLDWLLSHSDEGAVQKFDLTIDFFVGEKKSKMPVRSWMVHDAFPISFKLRMLNQNVEQNTTMIELVEIAYNWLEKVSEQ